MLELQVYVSSRRGVWLVGRLGTNGLPFDIIRNSRKNSVIQQLLPKTVISRMTRAVLNSRFSHTFYGLQPDYDVGAQAPAVSDEAPSRIVSGKILIKPGIERLTSDGVVFVDGTSVSDIDTIIFATG
jgi:dimethylaniline monooxygenase (N-oxide forming)